MKIDVKQLTKIILKKDEVLVVELDPEDGTTEMIRHVQKAFTTTMKDTGLETPKVIVSSTPLKMTKVKKE